MISTPDLSVICKFPYSGQCMVCSCVGECMNLPLCLYPVLVPEWSLSDIEAMVPECKVV